MSFTPANPTGWSPYSPVTADQLNHLDDQLVQAVDGVGGGTYSGPLEFTNVTGLGGTYDLDMTGDVTVTGSITATEDITCRDIYCDEINTTVGITATSPSTNITLMGGLITTGGGILSSQGGTITTQGGTLTTNGGTINTGNGAVVTGTGALTTHTVALTGMYGVVVSPPYAGNSRITMPSQQFVGVGSLQPWAETVSYQRLHSGGQFYGKLAVGGTVIFELHVPSECTVTKIYVWVQPEVAHNPGDVVVRPRVDIYAASPEDGVESFSDDQEDLLCASPFTQYNDPHIIEYTGTITALAPARVLYVKVTGETGANATFLRIYGMRYAVTRTTACLGGV